MFQGYVLYAITRRPPVYLNTRRLGSFGRKSHTVYPNRVRVTSEHGAFVTSCLLTISVGLFQAPSNTLMSESHITNYPKVSVTDERGIPRIRSCISNQRRSSGRILSSCAHQPFDSRTGVRHARGLDSGHREVQRTRMVSRLCLVGRVSMLFRVFYLGNTFHTLANITVVYSYGVGQKCSCRYSRNPLVLSLVITAAVKVKFGINQISMLSLCRDRPTLDKGD